MNASFRSKWLPGGNYISRRCSSCCSSQFTQFLSSQCPLLSPSSLQMALSVIASWGSVLLLRHRFITQPESRTNFLLLFYSAFCLLTSCSQHCITFFVFCFITFISELLVKVNFCLFPKLFQRHETDLSKHSNRVLMNYFLPSVNYFCWIHAVQCYINKM